MLDINAYQKPRKVVEIENKAMSEVVLSSVEKKMLLKGITKHLVTEECLSIFITNGSSMRVQNRISFEYYILT